MAPRPDWGSQSTNLMAITSNRQILLINKIQQNMILNPFFCISGQDVTRRKVQSTFEQKIRFQKEKKNRLRSLLPHSEMVMSVESCW